MPPPHLLPNITVPCDWVRILNPGEPFMTIPCLTAALSFNSKVIVDSFLFCARVTKFLGCKKPPPHHLPNSNILRGADFWRSVMPISIRVQIMPTMLVLKPPLLPPDFHTIGPPCIQHLMLVMWLFPPISKHFFWIGFCDLSDWSSWKNIQADSFCELYKAKSRKLLLNAHKEFWFRYGLLPSITDGVHRKENFVEIIPVFSTFSKIFNNKFFFYKSHFM